MEVVLDEKLLKTWDISHKCYGLFTRELACQMRYSRFHIVIIVASVIWSFFQDTLCCKCLGSLAFLYCKMLMFWRAGMRQGGKPLPLALIYIHTISISMFDFYDIKSLGFEFGIMLSSLASKCQHFKLKGLHFHYTKWLKKGHSNFKVLSFWSQWRYHYQIQITRSLYQKN